MHRRHILIAAAALVVPVAPMLFRAGPVRAQDGLLPVSAAQWFRLGDGTLAVALSDGFFSVTAEFMTGIDAAGMDRLAEAQLLRPEVAAMSGVNAWAVPGPDGVTLIDCGYGPGGGTMGHLAGSLALAGIDPAEVVRVLATHLHPDHVGGAVLDGRPAFPAAELVVPDLDHAYFTSPDARAAAPARLRGFFDAAAAVLRVHEGRVRRVAPGERVVPGLQYQPLHGHTPGHSGVQIGEGPGALLVWGDTVHSAFVQFPRPDVGIVLDVNPAAAVATRLSVMDRAASQRLLVAGSHIPFPGIGHVERQGPGYRFLPLPWQYR